MPQLDGFTREGHLGGASRFLARLVNAQALLNVTTVNTNAKQRAVNFMKRLLVVTVTRGKKRRTASPAYRKSMDVKPVGNLDDECGLCYSQSLAGEWRNWQTRQT